jgi:hypothetical protein
MMKKVLIFILAFMFSILTFSAQDDSTYYLMFAMPDIGVDYGTETDFLALKGAGNGNVIEGAVEYNLDFKLPVGDDYEAFTFNVLTSVSSSNKVKIVLKYIYPGTLEENVPTDFVDTDIIDEEYRFLGDADSNDAGKITKRTYISYSKISRLNDSYSISTNVEYRLPAAGDGDTLVYIAAYPIYENGKNEDYAYDSFQNGNVLTHFYEVRNKSDDALIFHTDVYYNHPTSVEESDSARGLKNWYKNHVATLDSDDNNYYTIEDPTIAVTDFSDTYKREELTIIKLVFYEPQTDTSYTPPDGVIEDLKIKATTNNSNRQRTSSVEVDTANYTEVMTGDPNPFKITEMEERGKY